MTTSFICVLIKDARGVKDERIEFDSSYFAGVIPQIGDQILNPSVLSGLSRSDPANREIWTVVDRVFNPRDNENYVALIVEARIPTEKDAAFAGV